jgi:hypothetical protein
MTDDIEQTGESRRSVLQRSAAGSLFAVPDLWDFPLNTRSCGGFFGGSDAQLEEAYFRILPPWSCEESGDANGQGTIAFALVYDSTPCESQGPEAELSASRGEVVADQQQDLGWYRTTMNPDVEDVDEEFREIADQFRADPAPLPFDDERTRYGRIENAVEFPVEPMFSGGLTEIPEIVFSGPLNRDAAPQNVHLQCTDGYVYNLPRIDRSTQHDTIGQYPADERYQMEQFEGEVYGIISEYSVDQDGVPLNEGFDQTSVELPTRGIERSNGSLLVEDMSHRAHPYLAALCSLAQRRMASLFRVANGIGRSGTPSAYVEAVRSQTSEAVADIVTTIGPSPPSTSEDIATAAIKKNVPAAVATRFGRAAGSTAGDFMSLYSLYETAKSLDHARAELEEWGETIGDRPIREWSDDCFMLPVRFDLLSNPPEDELDQNCVPSTVYEAPTTATAMASLSLFQYELALDAVATTDDFEEAADIYADLLRELHFQSRAIREQITETLVEAVMSADQRVAVRNAESYFQELPAAIESELELLQAVRDTFDGEVEYDGICADTGDGGDEDDGDGDDGGDGAALFRDDWEDGTWQEAPAWSMPGSFDTTVEVVDRSTPAGGSKALRLRDGTESAINLFTPTIGDRTDWSGAWTLRGLFYTEAVPGAGTGDPACTYHDLRVDAGSTQFLLSAYDPYDEAFEPVRIEGRSVDSSETAAGGLEEGRWYRYELAHDGDGHFTAKRWLAAETPDDGLEITATGAVPTAGEAILLYASGNASGGLCGDGSEPLVVDHAFVELSTE